MSLDILIRDAKDKEYEIVWTCSVAIPRKYRSDRSYSGHGAGRGNTPEAALVSAIAAANRPIHSYIPVIHKVSLKKISVDDL